MKKLTILLLFVSIAIAGLTWPIANNVQKLPGSMLGWDDAAGEWRPVKINPDGTMGVDATAAIGSLSAQLGGVTEVDANTYNLPANTNYAIPSGLTSSNRKFIEVIATDFSKELWFNYNTPAVIGDCRKAVTGLYFEIPKSVTLNVISSEAVKIVITEGGY